MLGIFSKTFMTATRNDHGNHWGRRTRFDTRRDAELIAHTEGRRRD